MRLSNFGSHQNLARWFRLKIAQISVHELPCHVWWFALHKIGKHDFVCGERNSSLPKKHLWIVGEGQWGTDVEKNPDPFSLPYFLVESVWLSKWDNRIEKRESHGSCYGCTYCVRLSLCTLILMKWAHFDWVRTTRQKRKRENFERLHTIVYCAMKHKQTRRRHAETATLLSVTSRWLSCHKHRGRAWAVQENQNLRTMNNITLLC